MDADSLLERLSGEQRAAVETTDGPMLILAGAGSGKTRVITYRIAYLIAKGLAAPDQILALTFTNKAAREMRERVGHILGGPLGLDVGHGTMWITTFHSFGSRILRRHADQLGYEPGFAIYDADDSTRIIRKIFKELAINDERITPSGFLGWLDSTAAEEMELSARDMGGRREPGSFLERKFADIFRAYRDHLKKHNAMDFRDLLLRPLELFTRFPELRAYYQEHFRYMLVDEYQDTNRIQYQLTRILSARHGNVAAVGDEDQSIYSWRGADINNILDFEKDYGPKMRIFHLVENYRSPGTVLEAANAVITRNALTHKKDRPLTPMKPRGKLINLFMARDGEEEAMFVCRQVATLTGKGVPLTDIAVFYRTHAQSRLLEQRLARERVPYRIYGGTPFFSKKEIKDLLAYLWVIANPRDAISLERAIMNPKRGFGETSLEKVSREAAAHGMSLFEALQQGLGVTPAVRKKLDPFFDVIERLKELAEQGSLLALATELIDRVKYREWLAAEAREDRDELVDEFLSLLAEYDNARRDEGMVTEGVTPLLTFLEGVSLQASVDGHSRNNEALTLMTVHNAKGLEFPYVFLTGLEEKLFPHASSYEDPMQMEEERRLFYVGITRTEEELWLTCARQRMIRGATQFQLPSRFIGEMKPECLQMAGGRQPMPLRPPPRATIDPIYDDD